jgi:type I restriction enzyme S subunit
MLVPVPPRKEQEAIVSLIQHVEKLIHIENRQLPTLTNLKRAAMRELFAYGLRGESQKETEIGLIATSWSIVSMEEVSYILSTKMSYGELLDRQEAEDDPSTYKVLGIKVADMGRIGAEVAIKEAELERYISIEEAESRCAPPGVIVFPKNGAAIATNKKRIVDHWSAFDPNVMGLLAKDGVLQRYLFHWMQGFDLGSIVKPGPVPHFNKSDLARVYVPLPETIEEQHEVVAVLDAIDRKIDLHRRKRTVLDELFKALLHKLMTGEIRVADLDMSALQSHAKPEAAA